MDALMLRCQSEALDEDFVDAAPFPSIEIRLTTRFSWSFQADNVNCAPGKPFQELNGDLELTGLLLRLLDDTEEF